ncbi:MAG: hypothetical protein PHS60_13225, partial [Zavarzinia sp.]|nr:hypothetical protein [Zavarzinia sp.]
ERATGEKVLNERVVGQMNRMLSAVIDGGTGHAAALGRPAGGKTGTSQDYRNAWFVGLTGNLVAGIWVGNDDNTPMIRVTGGGLPARIWQRFMTAALTGTEVVPLPDGPSDTDRGLLDQLVDFLGGDSGGSDSGGTNAGPAPAVGTAGTPARPRSGPAPRIEYEYPTGRD